MIPARKRLSRILGHRRFRTARPQRELRRNLTKAVIEALESRVLLSYTVTTIADTGAGSLRGNTGGGICRRRSDRRLRIFSNERHHHVDQRRFVDQRHRKIPHYRRDVSWLRYGQADQSTHVGF